MSKSQEVFDRLVAHLTGNPKGKVPQAWPRSMTRRFCISPGKRMGKA
jgi:hypothetical protein